MDEPRSRATRARAELALVRLLHELREEAVFLVVLGGLVPEVLSRDDGVIPVHLGTTDVDVLLITHVDPDADLGGVERALERMEFNADNAEGWRWRGPVAGAAVKLEFLCDLPDHPEHEVIRPRGCTTLAAELPALRSTFLEVRERYANTADIGALGYAEQALEVEPEANASQLRADAVDAVQRFFAALDP